MQAGRIGQKPQSLSTNNNSNNGQNNPLDFDRYRNQQKLLLDTKVTTKEQLLEEFLGLTHILRSQNEDLLIEKLINFIDYLSSDRDHNPPLFENNLYKEYLRLTFDFNDENAKKLLALCQHRNVIPFLSIPVSFRSLTSSQSIYTNSAQIIRKYLAQYIPDISNQSESDRAKIANDDIALIPLYNLTGSTSHNKLTSLLNKILFNEASYNVDNLLNVQGNKYFKLLSKDQKNYLLQFIKEFHDTHRIVQDLLKMEHINVYMLREINLFQQLTPQYQELVQDKYTKCLDILNTIDKWIQIYYDAVLLAGATDQKIETVLLKKINELPVPFLDIKIRIKDTLLAFLLAVQIYEEGITDKNLNEFFRFKLEFRDIILHRIDISYTFTYSGGAKKFDLYKVMERIEMNQQFDTDPTISNSIKNKLKHEYEKVAKAHFFNEELQFNQIFSIKRVIVNRNKKIQNIKNQILTTIEKLEQAKQKLMVDKISPNIDNLTKYTKLNLSNEEKPAFTKHDNCIEQLTALMNMMNITNIIKFEQEVSALIKSATEIIQPDSKLQSDSLTDQPDEISNNNSLEKQ